MSSSPEKISIPRETTDGVVQYATNIRELIYRVAVGLHPAEIRARLIKIIQDIESEKEYYVDDTVDHTEVIEALDYNITVYKRIYDEFGGDIDDRMVQMYREYDYDERFWQNEIVDEADLDFILNDQFRHLARKFGIPVGKLRVMVAGCGTGRDVRAMIEWVNTQDPDNAEQFIQNVLAFDYVDVPIEKARKDLAALGVPPANVFQGNFRSLDGQYQMRDQHLVVGARQHGSWHNTTEEQWRAFFSTMSNALTRGGRLLIDTIPNPPGWDGKLDNPFQLKNVKKLESLNMYHLLWLYYCHRMNPAINDLLQNQYREKSTINLRNMGRFLIEERAPGVSNIRPILREIPNPDYLERLCAAYQPDLRLRIESDLMTPAKYVAPYEDKGEEWLLDKGLERFLKDVLIPEHLSAQQLGIQDENDEEDAIDELYGYLAEKIVPNYIHKRLSWKKIS